MSVADNVGKGFHSGLRTAAMEHAGDYLEGAQFGGPKHLGCDFASHALRSLERHAAERKMCFAALFTEALSSTLSQITLVTLTL